ncbi:restriction endonuclease [Kitasatospora sp. NPDC059146]|uniref:restriction endonuclease n=1 Tax=unclassified Kitasatospora TaxID=2633591 RepID=UPI003683FEC5
MIIDRTAKIVPTRYNSRELRKAMGGLIAAADHDDLLAAWIWTTEGWLLRQTYHRLSEQLDKVEHEIKDARRRLRADWSDAMDRTPQEVRQATTRSLEQLIEALEAEQVVIREGINTCAGAWKSMSQDFGIDPIHKFSDRTPADPSPAECLDDVWNRTDHSPERLAALLADHRTDMHVVALREQRRRELLGNGPLSVEGQFLRDVYQAVVGYRDRVAEEKRQADGGKHPGRDRLALPMRMMEVHAVERCRWWALIQERNAAQEAVDACADVWDEMAEDFGLVPVDQTAPRRADGPARVVALAKMSRDVEAAHSRLDQILSDHREAVHGEALTANRRITYLTSGSSVGLDAIAEFSYRDFETLVADLAARDGLSVNRAQGGPGDLGADVTAVTPDQRRVVFQAKHTSTSRTIGTPDLQRFNGTARPHHQADIAVMITNGRFSEPARKFAAQHRIQLVNQIALRRWATFGDPLSEIVDMAPSMT